MLLSCTFLLLSRTQAAVASCASPANAIEAENCLPGNPSSQWDISGAGDASIQGFATDISVNRGGTVFFKLNTPAAQSRLDIYRMGYYGGQGARLVASVAINAPQNQPACLTNTTTGLMDCGNWAVSASWTVPATATSGIYFARAVRLDTGGASHIVFIVRNDASTSDLLFQTSDLTWQAYNDYGNKNLYGCNGAYDLSCRAFKVSYNRPFHTRVFEPESWVFNAEYPMVRWLEANGYDVSYFTGVDAERNAALIRNHKVWLSNGHDEYWSGGERASVTAARDAAVHLAFFSGNTTFWKTRWENAIDGSGTPYRTLVCYKETHANAVIDPADPPTWTGTWRDPRFSPPADGGQPENALAGTLFRMNGGQNATITVPQADGRMRFWRNTTVATLGTGQTATLAPGTIGAEFDDDEDNGVRPAGLIELSNTPITDSSNYLLDYGTTYGAGTAIHKVTLYRAASGALVFATGTYQWAWGLDANHDRSNLGSTTDVRMQQATVNLFADMGVQPATRQTGLVAATGSTDTTAPGSTIVSPTAGSTVTPGTAVTISGTASDGGGGVVGSVEVSVDGGATWHPASGRASWTYSWNTAGRSGSVTIKSRAVDDSGNLEIPSAGVTVSVGGSGSPCTTNCTIWPGTATPVGVDGGPDSPVELGVKFTSDVAGTITGIRFYKASTNTGTHVGNLWTSTGTNLASATFTSETASGWQQVNFAPVAITANTVYVASYHANGGHYSDDDSYFSGKGVDSPPLHALADGVAGANGAYTYGANSQFPTQGYISTNYWVDVVFQSAGPTLNSIAVTPANPPAITVGASQQFTATGTYSDASTQNLTNQVTWSSSSTAVATISAGGLATAVAVGTTTISATLGTVSGNTTLTVQNPPPPVITTTSLPNGTVGVAYPTTTLAASGGTPPYRWSIATGLPPGLSLNTNTGAIGGTPTTSGTYMFTAQVSDSGNPVQTGTKVLSIAITAATTTTSTTVTTTTTSTTTTSTTTASTSTTSTSTTTTVPTTSTAPTSTTVTTTSMTTTTAPTTSTTRPATTTTTTTTVPTTVPTTTTTSTTSTTTTTVPTVATIWPSTATPIVAADPDTSAVELGIKFRSDVNGFITGIRFYKSATNTGTHVGNLWSSTGTKLASATFSGESASGWQQVNFATPVAITANMVYVASYHTTRGHYADDTGYFAAAGRDSPPLHALQDGVNGPNGAYQYGSSAFPTNGYQSSNYWVDVVFKTSVP